MTSVAVVGAGAAGLVAAIFAASQGADVILIERTPDGGRKILISGGGRCNILPSVLAPERFVTDSPPHLMRSMLRAWPLHEQRAFFEDDLNVPLALEEESGKLFPASNRARDVRDGLVELARRRGVRMQFGGCVNGLESIVDGWNLRTTMGDVAASAVVLATGGLSVPMTGSDGTGLQIAGVLGHRMIDTYPALTPLLGSNLSGHAALSGVSLSVRLRGKTPARFIETHGGFLFTHRGYSGPSVLDISHLAARRGLRSASSTFALRASADRSAAPDGSTSSAALVDGTASSASIRTQWSALDAAAWKRELDSPSVLVSSIVARHVPSRLGDQLISEAGIPADRRTSSLRRRERTALIERLTSYELPWTGDEGYKKAEVTGGGVALDEVDPGTLESKRCPRLYLCGEILDVFGPIGGHNFAWAWSTGRAAGLAAGTAALGAGSAAR